MPTTHKVTAKYTLQGTVHEDKGIAEFEFYSDDTCVLGWAQQELSGFGCHELWPTLSTLVAHELTHQFWKEYAELKREEQ